ncbi:olfactory receptor 6F1-like [Bufo bufo]|uniref:olfactory receptor 6F1-like n=1 Tax=Bufo bufo TaxID=8384 RepID=UPI001ABE0C80|nr:olfactory receptor 6F1-like [Bufo bufo]
MKVHEVNSTTVTEFLILGFPALNDYKLPFFSIVLLMYSMTICENLLIILLVSTSQRLRSPMYFFLGHLALSDIILVTIIVPKMLDIIIREGSTVPYVGCLAQFYFYGVSVSAECFLLTAMSYDRYLAICRPLHYISVMGVKLKYSLIISSWGISFMLVLITLVILCNIDFCGPHVINHFFCDFSPILQPSCLDKTPVSIAMVVLCIPVILLPFVLIIISYVCIFMTIFGISSTSGRQKTFSTCASHLVVVSTYYGSITVSSYKTISEKDGSSKSSSVSNAAAIARTEAAKVKAAFAKQEMKMKEEKAQLEAEKAKQQASLEMQKVFLDAKLEKLAVEKETAAAIAEAEFLEAMEFPETESHNSVLSPELGQQDPVRRTSEYVRQHSRPNSNADPFPGTEDVTYATEESYHPKERVTL